MITTAIASIIVARPAPIRVAKLIYAPTKVVERFLGPGRTFRNLAGIFYEDKGFTRVWANDTGSKMSSLDFRLDANRPWKSALAAFGLSAAHVSTRPLPVERSNTPLLRNALELTGISGIPRSHATGSPWRVIFQEYALVNKTRAHQLRPKIMAASGEERFRLIRSCYDWFAEVRFLDK